MMVIVACSTSIIFTAFGIGIILLEGAYLFPTKKTARALRG